MDSISKPNEIRWVSSTDSAEFTQLSWALTHSSLLALDAEWKPTRSHTHRSSSFPTVSLLQIACRVDSVPNSVVPTTEPHRSRVSVFLVDLLAIDLRSLFDLLRETFVSPDVLKLGFRFKQDLVYLSSTFCSQGCDPGFDRVEPFMDITSVYNHLVQKQLGRKPSKQWKSLAAICGEVLGVSLSKELQCSDWSLRPLTEDQKIYAASDAHCLLEIFDVFQRNLLEEGLSQVLPLESFEIVAYSFCDSSGRTTKLPSANAIIGLKEIFEKLDDCDHVCRTKFCQASDMVRSASLSEIRERNLTTVGCVSRSISTNTFPLDVSLSKIIRKYGDKLLLKESDKKPRASKKKVKKQSPLSSTCKEICLSDYIDWQGPPPWDLSIGGDGCPKFLCDVMVEGLAKHLRCVGIDAAVPYVKKPDSRQLIDQARKEKRVLLTRDAKLLRHEYLIRNQVYRVNSLLKNEQLLEANRNFDLKISEDQLMSRCTKCNGRFIQKPLTAEEAVEAAKGFQVIPNCLFNRNLMFWQCTDCNQLYWEFSSSASYARNTIPQRSSEIHRRLQAANDIRGECAHRVAICVLMSNIIQVD
ncbi:hypothetical protein Sjap_005585 [Stephania japonica]|uniref:3'-5' exonuclease domain-containing protein n=1 Tax=Stephania japonica TaxID=461633 RepID=A0AAP0K6Q4_9MAGN